MPNKLMDFIKASNESLTKAEFKAAFARVVSMVRLAIEQLDAKVDKRLSEVDNTIIDAKVTLEELKNQYLTTIQETKTANKTTFAGIRKYAIEGIDALFNRLGLNERFNTVLADYETKIRNLDNKIQEVPKIDVDKIGQDVLSKIPIETSEDIRNKLELLDGEERLDAKYIKNLPEATKTIVETGGGGSSTLFGMMDVHLQGVTVNQSIKWNGTKWVAYTPSSATTNVWGETPSGSGTTFTLAHTPASGTLRVYRGGSRQSLTEDYTLSGTTLTLLVTLDPAEILRVDYEY